ncbi:hypothetical protein GCM10011613_28150 [Cellvibrio zantedeschiae]|uniref:Uncharacterized protein n=2 Tax=Cellvibrio zantedeschiae TaxID=1237077 RepID=A0ABQ3BAX4_9GAMM|nr:hypothetical protein GCM10011613_28150 [Cellvibrio zantedeschiae]
MLSAQAAVLATSQLVTPLIPGSQKSLSIDLLSIDPKQPVWVIYQMVGVSADAKPEGEMVLDSSFEMIPLSMGDSVVVFKPKNMEIVKATKGLGDQLTANVGERKPEELKAMFGADMYAAYEAISRNEGTYLTGTIVKEYQTDGKRDVRLMTSFNRVKGIQPVMLNVIVGQGEIPARYKQFGKKSLSPEKIITALISFAIAGVWLMRRRKQ